MRTVKILVVEDDPADQELIRRSFRDPSALCEPVELEVVDSVDRALNILQGETFDIILADHSHLGSTGIQLLQTLRASGNRTPFVMLTGSADIAIAVSAFHEGAADFVVKNLSYGRGLPVVVRRVLDRQETLLAHAAGRESPQEEMQRQLDKQTRALHRAVQEGDALRQVGQALACAREMPAVLNLVSQAAAQLTQAQAAAVILCRGNEYVLVSGYGPIPYAAGLKRPDLPALLSADWVGTTTAEMHDDDEVMGMLWVGRTHSCAFEPAETDLLTALAALTALSISKLRSREQLRRLRDEPHMAASRTARVRSAGPPPTPEKCALDTTEPLLARAEPRTVLVVDDSERVLMQARIALQDTMTVLTATSGRLALEKYAATRPAIVVVDLAMPDMDGWQTLEALQRLGCSSCVALALRGDTLAHDRARQAGYLGVVEKPFRPDELQAQIGALLSAEQLGHDHFVEDDGVPVVVVPASKVVARLLPLFDRHLRALAEEGSDRVILDAAQVTEVTPEHVAILVRLISEARTLGITPAICAPNESVVAKLRQIVEIRDALYAGTRDAAKKLLH